MKKFKRVICLSMAALMLMLPLSACKSSRSVTTESSYSYYDGDDVALGTTGTGSNGANNGGSNDNGGSNNNGGSNTDKDKIAQKFENLDLKGESIRIAATWNHGPGKSGTSTVNTLQQKRIAELEKKYNCKFEFMVVDGGEMGDRIRTSVAASKPYVDFVILYTSSIPSYAYNGYLQNMDEIEAIDLSEEKWNPGDVSNGAFNNGHYSFAITASQPRYILAFNKTMFEKNGWTSPYDLYRQDKWNWNEAMKLAQIATDKNADRYGIGGMEIGVSSIIASFGGDVVSIGKNGKPTFTGDSENCQNAITFLSEMKTMYKDFIYSPDSYTWTTGVLALADGKVAMTITQLYMIRENILEMDDDYGIVPIPKGTNKSGRYASIREDVPTWTMLANNPLAQEKGFILDLYTEPYKGYEDIVSRAEMETYCRDNDSVEILLDIEKNYGLFNYSTWFTEASTEYTTAINSVIDGSATFSEAMGKSKSKIVANINETYESWQK